MSNAPLQSAQPAGPTVTRPRWRVSLIWMVPVIAALIGLSMVVQAWYGSGPEVKIRFKTATGLEAGKTPVKYKDVTVGGVSGIELSEDRTNVVVTVSLVKSAAGLARKDSRFWVVRPRIGVGGVSGIDTLLSGAYIGVDEGNSEDSASDFTGLEAPPPVIGGAPGRTFVVRAGDLGSLDIGSPVYYRRIQVGRVSSYHLDDDGLGVRVHLFIDAPYDRFVTTSARFWNASGVDVSISASGLKLNTQSLATVLAGGIAFASQSSDATDPAPENAEFLLEKDQQAAMTPPDGAAEHIRLNFVQSVRGMVIGAPVVFAGVDLGQVTGIQLDYDPVHKHFISVVDTEVFPERLGRVLKKLPSLQGSPSQERGAEFLKQMVANGLRAQARSGNVLTGQLYVSLDFVRNAPSAVFDMNARPLVLPTVRGEFDKLQEQLGSIVSKIEKMPLDSIGRNLDASLKSIDKTLGTFDKTLGQINGQVLPEATATMNKAQQALGAVQDLASDDAPLRLDLGLTMQELRRTARSVRGLTDLLGERPESLFSGRPQDAPLLPTAPRQDIQGTKP